MFRYLQESTIIFDADWTCRKWFLGHRKRNIKNISRFIVSPVYLTSHFTSYHIDTITMSCHVIHSKAHKDLCNFIVLYSRQLSKKATCVFLNSYQLYDITLQMNIHPTQSKARKKLCIPRNLFKGRPKHQLKKERNIK
jgi:hypothetical protein